MDLLTTLLAATEEHAHSQTAFLIVGGVLAAFAVAIGALGLSRPQLGARAGSAIMGVGSLLVAGTMVAIVAVS